jgi:TPR repeat protein
MTSARPVALLGILASLNGGDAEGCWSLGMLFEQGLGVRQNDMEAMHAYELACDGGAKLGCVSVAKMIDTGRGAASACSNPWSSCSARCTSGVTGEATVQKLMISDVLILRTVGCCGGPPGGLFFCDPSARVDAER